MKKSRFQQLQEEMGNRVGPEKAPALLKSMENHYNAICQAYAGHPMEKHIRNNIGPAAAAFRALLTEGMERSEAADLSGKAFLTLMEVPAQAIRKAMKVPGLYHLMPWLWKVMMPKLFSPDSGFRFQFYPTGKDQVKFDMVACPYYQLCQELDCMELAPVFCATDDLCYGHMHEKLIWDRTKTIARGADLCDFNLYISKDK